MTRLIVLQKNGSAKQINMTRTPFVVGRADSCDLVLDNPLVSRSHAVFEAVGNAMTLRDLHSHNGTYVNGQRVEGSRVAQRRRNQDRRLPDPLPVAGRPIGAAEALRLVTVPGRLADIDLQRLGEALTLPASKNAGKKEEFRTPTG